MKRFGEAEGCEMESMNMANVLVLFSSGAAGDDTGGPAEQPAGRVFECKTCSRRFPSFQALGGHRASHKKPRLVGGDPAAAAALGLQQSPPAPAKPRVHECSICGLEFAIGQALGGHMRRHRAAAAEAGSAVPHGLLEEKKAPGVAVDAGEKREAVVCLGLDLNLPPSENDKDFLSLGFGRGLHMVDCFH